MIELQNYYSKLSKEKVAEITAKASEISASLKEKTTRIAELKSLLKTARNPADRQSFKSELSNLTKEVDNLLLQQNVCVNEACKQKMKELAEDGDGEVRKVASIL